MPFSDVIGQEQAVDLVRRAFRRGTVPGSHLIYGPGGVGEEDLALGICQALFCEEFEDDFCGKCRSCLRVANGTFGDVHRLSPETSWYSIEQIRELGRAAGMHPYEADYQVFVLGNAEMMRVEAANSLLKTLEEPSPHTVILLITTSPGALLPTILSRCRKIRLGSLSRRAVVEKLVSKGMDREEATEVAVFTGGRLDHLESILSGEFLQTRKEFVDSIRRIRETGDLGGLAFGTSVRDRDKAVESLQWFARLLRNGLAARTRSDADALSKETASLFDGMNDDRLIRLFEKTVDACQAIRGNANVELVLGSVMTEFAGG